MCEDVLGSIIKFFKILQKLQKQNTLSNVTIKRMIDMTSSLFNDTSSENPDKDIQCKDITPDEINSVNNNKTENNVYDWFKWVKTDKSLISSVHRFLSSCFFAPTYMDTIHLDNKSNVYYFWGPWLVGGSSVSFSRLDCQFPH